MLTIDEINRLEQENKELKEKLEKYEEMAKKGLEEFKDVGGCWGCGIQLASDEYFASCSKYRTALEEIREIADYWQDCEDINCYQMIKILNKINEVLGAEE